MLSDASVSDQKLKSDSAPEAGSSALVASSSRLKLYWRACYVKHFFHVLPGETLLEFGAGDGTWTKELDRVFRGENPITAAVSDLPFETLPIKGLRVINIADLSQHARNGSFDYIVGSLMESETPVELMTLLYDLLKPGGRMLFFQPNASHPLRRLSRSRGQNGHGQPLHAATLRASAAAAGFTNIAVTPYDLNPSSLSRTSVARLDPITAVLEHAPACRSFASTLICSATKPGSRIRAANLAEHLPLYGTVSVVIPCHNEEANIQQLIDELLKLYGLYIREIIVVNDNSTDGTAHILSRIANSERRVKVITRGKPNGVGLALSDGYRAASGRYILSMDSDFVDILPEFRDLFDAIVNGADGAIGSRFSHESVVAGYPSSKMLCNRVFHLIIKLMLVRRVRDISNNLKLYKSEILKKLEIESPHFSANLETGLKPILAGYDIREVPISWINRTPEMGSSSFELSRVGGDYLRTLLRIMRAEWFQGRSLARKRAPSSDPRARAASQR